MAICLYHANCLDGTAAAWVVLNHAKEEVKCIPVKYGEEPDLLLIKDKTVYIVDFSYPVEVMEQLELHSKRLVILDHHASAERALAEFKPKKPTTEIIFDMTQSGAGLTWHYFNPDVEAPLHIQYVQDRDLWTWILKDTKEYTAYLFANGFRLKDYSKAIMEKYDTAIQIGSYLVKDHENRVARALTHVRFEVVAFGDMKYKVPVVNCPADLSSEVGNQLCKVHNAPFSLTYSDGKDERYWSVRGNGTFDCSKFAESKGGGGHRNAAGFKTDLPH